MAASLLLSTTSLSGGFTEKGNHTNAVSIGSAGTKISAVISEKYNSWQLSKQGISIDLFTYAMKGYEYLSGINKIANKSIITIIDFSKPSSAKRLFVLNIQTGEIVFKTLVAHGRNSGKEWASKFSNAASSFASSLGLAHRLLSNVK